MKIKRRKSSQYNVMLSKLFGIIFNNKTKKIFLALVFLIFFAFGLIAGLLISGYFGTLDKPSERLNQFLYDNHIDLVDEKDLVKGIMLENFRIPFNYLKGKFTSIDEIRIDVDFLDYQQLEFKRLEALQTEVRTDTWREGLLFSTDDDFVPARIRFEDKDLRADIRLKGDWVDHLQGDDWSFRIKLEDQETLFGMRTFSIQKPVTKKYLHQLVFIKMMKNEGLIVPRNRYVQVVLNGENLGVYNLEEHFDKILLESQELREGPILKFNEELLWRGRNIGVPFDENFHMAETFLTTDIDAFQSTRTLEDPMLNAQFLKAKNLLEAFRRGDLTASEVFDVDKFARFVAVTDVSGSQHSLAHINLRFYYNPVTSLLEPIGFDANAGIGISEIAIVNEAFRFDGYGLYNELFKDEVFSRAYFGHLERLSNPEYLDNFFAEIEDELEQNEAHLFRNNPAYHFSTSVYYTNQEKINTFLKPHKAFQAYYHSFEDNRLVLQLGNIQQLDVEILEAVYDGTALEPVNDYILEGKDVLDIVNYGQYYFVSNVEIEYPSLLIVRYRIFGTNEVREEEVFPWVYYDSDFLGTDFIRQSPNIHEFEFLRVNEEKEIITFSPGDWTLNENLIIPSGYTVFCSPGLSLDFSNDAKILSYSEFVCVGSLNNPVKFFSSDNTGQGLAILNSEGASRFEKVTFQGLDALDEEGWTLLGAVNFYESPVEFVGVSFLDSKSEDALNIIRSDFLINNSFFNTSFSDCFDGDFVTGTVKGTIFSNCGNDGLDFSGSRVFIDDVLVTNAGDKSLSAGEASNIEVSNIEVDGAFIGVASKDNSQIHIENIRLSNADYGFGVYEKKSEYGPASISIVRALASDVVNANIIERNSQIIQNDEVVHGSEMDVYFMLYGEE